MGRLIVAPAAAVIAVSRCPMAVVSARGDAVCGLVDMGGRFTLDLKDILGLYVRISLRIGETRYAKDH